MVLQIELCELSTVLEPIVFAGCNEIFGTPRISAQFDAFYKRWICDVKWPLLTTLIQIQLPQLKQVESFETLEFRPVKETSDVTDYLQP